LLGLTELFVDQRLERVERLRTAQAATVDEERRRTRRAQVACELLIGLDRRLVFVAVERVLELARVQAEVLGVALELVALQCVLVREQLLVHLPELALIVRRQ